MYVCVGVCVRHAVVIFLYGDVNPVYRKNDFIFFCFLLGCHLVIQEKAL